jgi:hypothetical protein
MEAAMARIEDNALPRLAASRDGKRRSCLAIIWRRQIGSNGSSSGAESRRALPCRMTPPVLAGVHRAMALPRRPIPPPRRGRRLNRLAALLPADCWGVLFDVCGLGKGLQLVETERRWPRRSAKLVLRIGLDQLAAQFGPDPARNGRGWRGDAGLVGGKAAADRRRAADRS